MAARRLGWMIFTVLLLGVSQAATEPQAIQFVYIHGTNQNSPQSHTEFNARVSKLHPQVMMAMTDEPLVKIRLLENGQRSISPQTLNFFWGDRSRIAIQAMKRNLLSPQLMTGLLRLAARARKKLDYTLHDAIWLEKDSNKKGVLNDLFLALDTREQQPIVLMGHSAGSLLAFNLLIYRLPYLDIHNFATELKVDPKVLANIEAQGNANTCLEALMSSSAIRYNAEGNLTPFFKGLEPTLPESLLQDYRTRWLANLPLYTKQYCLAPGRVKGVVTFGSPLTMFYSTVANPKKDENYLTASMMSYLMAENIFWLHINHFNDFIAVPLPGKKQILAMITERLSKAPNLRGGFIQNTVCMQHGANVINAHSWYWVKPKAFAQSMAETYRKGFQEWYPEEKPAP